MADKLKTVEQIKQRAQSKATNFSELFRSPIGKEVLEDLKEQFEPESLCVENQHETIIRAAQRDVVRWIEEVIERGNRNVEG